MVSVNTLVLFRCDLSSCMNPQTKGSCQQSINLQPWLNALCELSLPDELYGSSAHLCLCPHRYNGAVIISWPARFDPFYPSLKAIASTWWSPIWSWQLDIIQYALLTHVPSPAQVHHKLALLFYFLCVQDTTLPSSKALGARWVKIYLKIMKDDIYDSMWIIGMRHVLYDWRIQKSLRHLNSTNESECIPVLEWHWLNRITSPSRFFRILFRPPSPDVPVESVIETAGYLSALNCRFANHHKE